MLACSRFVYILLPDFDILCQTHQNSLGMYSPFSLYLCPDWIPASFRQVGTTSRSVSSPASFGARLVLTGSGIRLGFSRGPFAGWNDPALRWMTAPGGPGVARGRLRTAKSVGNRSDIGILLGLETSVQSWSVGKNGMLLSGFLSSRIAQRLVNSGQALSQLAWEFTPQDTQ